VAFEKVYGMNPVFLQKEESILQKQHSMGELETIASRNSRIANSIEEG
jgi:hypothetical protein